MKKFIIVLSAAFLTAFCWSCSDTKERYIDLATGEEIEVKKDDKTGIMVNKETNQPVYMYVDTKEKDTIYGKTGESIKGHVVMGDGNKYMYDADVNVSTGSEYKDGDYKVEVEKDGDTKTKDGDKKVKTDGETGERKVKKD
ncbi:MAG: hypothetical protein ABI688_01370 [Bacteroidota bacterium]